MPAPAAASAAALPIIPAPMMQRSNRFIMNNDGIVQYFAVILKAQVAADAG
jgi:hypothetical protein